MCCIQLIFPARPSGGIINVASFRVRDRRGWTGRSFTPAENPIRPQILKGGHFSNNCQQQWSRTDGRILLSECKHHLGLSRCPLTSKTTDDYAFLCSQTWSTLVKPTSDLETIWYQDLRVFSGSSATNLNFHFVLRINHFSEAPCEQQRIRPSNP